MKKILSLLFISIMLLPLLSQAAISLETGVYRLEWTAENQGYVGLLVMLSDTEGKMRVKHYNPLTENEEIVEMSMRMSKTKHGDALLGYDPIDPTTNRSVRYSADNLIFRRLTNGQWQVFNVDDQGVTVEISFSGKLSSRQESLALAEFGWVWDRGEEDALRGKAKSKKFRPQPEQQQARTAIEWYNIAQVFEESGRYAEAVKAYNQVIQTPDITQEICLGCTWAHRGLCLEQLGRRDEALLSYRKALEIRPDIDFARQGIIRLIKGGRL